MLGIASVELALAFLLSIGGALLCVVYGIVMYNQEGPLSRELRGKTAKEK